MIINPHSSIKPAIRNMERITAFDSRFGRSASIMVTKLEEELIFMGKKNI